MPSDPAPNKVEAARNALAAAGHSPRCAALRVAVPDGWVCVCGIPALADHLRAVLLVLDATNAPGIETARAHPLLTAVVDATEAFERARMARDGAPEWRDDATTEEDDAYIQRLDVVTRTRLALNEARLIWSAAGFPRDERGGGS